MTDPLGQSQVIPYLIGLAQKGYTIHLISCEKEDKFKKLNTIISKLLVENNIRWIPVPYSTLPSVLAKQLNLLKIKKEAIHICKTNAVSIIHCRSYMAALIGLQLKQKYGLKFIFDMRGFWADERIDGNIWKLSNPIQKKLYHYFKKKEIQFLKHADYTISLTENAKNEILNWKEFKNNPIPIEIIPCCADFNLFTPKNINQAKLKNLSTELNISENDFIISYLGSIGTWYMLDEMLDFFKELLHSKKNAKLLIITPDRKEDIISTAAKKGISTDKLIIVSAQRNEVPVYISLSKLAIYFIKPLYSKKASSATKTAEIMGMQIPIITNTGIGDSDVIIKESKGGLMVSEFTEKEYIRIINQIDDLLLFDKTKMLDTAHKYFSLEKGVLLYESVYKKLK